MIESDKATLSLIAPESGKIEILVKEGETVKVDSVACRIDTSVEVPDEEQEDADEVDEKIEEEKAKAEGKEDKDATGADSELKEKETSSEPSKPSESVEDLSKVRTTPLARKMMDVENINVEDVIKGLRRISSDDVSAVLNQSDETDDTQFSTSVPKERTVERQKMSQLRKHLSKRLVQVKNETAMLTTFNEVDMQNLMNLRKQHQPEFVKKYGYKIGLISFFLKACSLALKLHPKVNSQIDDDEIVTHSFVDISVAVQAPKGLMVPVIRDVDTISLAKIESELKRLADQAMSGRISMDEMTGGTFTLTNGGVFGSLLSTPLINPPQSAIIGMHNIVERPVAINGKVEIRPMMYIALSYDHRIIDGKDAVGFLVDIKKMIENPNSMLHGGQDEGKKLLGL